MNASTPAQAHSPWKKGDFHIIGREAIIVGEQLCDDCHVGTGHRVLDVACGSGNTALSAARRRNNVSGIDLAENLIERAKLRAQAEGFDIDFRTGTAEELPYEDESFDYVLSTFGVMFATDQQKAADELLRVCKRGGTIGMANWVPESFPGQMFAATVRYMPAPPPGRPPIEWGTVPGLQRLFDGRVSDMRLYDRNFRMRFDSPAAWFAEFRDYFGPVQMLYSQLDENTRTAYQAEMSDYAARYNRATDGTLAVAMAYVDAVMKKV